MISSGAPVPENPEVVLLQYGAIGAIALLALTAVWVLYRHQGRERQWERDQLLTALAAAHARADRAEEALAKLNAEVKGETLAILQEATRAVSDAVAQLRHG